MITYLQGNILHEQADAIVNTVNTVGVMGKGLALQFKKAFPHNFAVYKKACDDHTLVIGSVLSVGLDSLTPPHYIINVPTKTHWRGKSTLAHIEAGLDALVDEANRLNLQSVAIPALGSGLGGLNWQDVNALIQHKLSQAPNIDWRVFPPQQAPVAANMPNRTQRPTMTKGRAVLLCLIDRYVNQGLAYELSLLEVQKLVYFLTASGEPLNQVKFVKHHYGPYADVLRHVLNHIEGHFISGYADGQNKPNTSIEVFPDAVNEAKAVLANHPNTLEKFDQVSDLVEGFESPYGMELLATVHWVATQDIPEQSKEVAAGINAVHAWNRHKQDMKPTHIASALTVLAAKQWLTKVAQV